MKNIAIGVWNIPVLQFQAPAQELSSLVIGLVGNSVPTLRSGRERTAQWKILVAVTAKSQRKMQWSPDWIFAVTVGFSFHPGSHGNRKMDVENFLKPTLDGFAAGLFCSPDTDLFQLKHWDFDDLGFQHLLVHRLSNAQTRSQEGAALYISSIHDDSAKLYE